MASCLQGVLLMPRYLYECSCGFRSERQESLYQRPDPPVCPRCEGDRPMIPVPTAAAVHFKGQGWTPKFHGPKDSA